MLIFKYLLLITLPVLFSLFLMLIAAVMQFFVYVGFLKTIVAIKFGAKFYQILAKFFLFMVGINAPKAPIQAGNFIVANHVSWLDGVVLAATHGNCTFVVTDELSSHFYVGHFLQRFGAIHISDNPSSLVNAMELCQACLENGISVVVFPEGTTGSQHSLGQFHSLFFEVPIKQCQSVYVTTINYTISSSAQGFPCWIGDEYIFHNMYRVLKVLPLGITVKLNSNEMPSVNTERQALADKARDLVASLLGISVVVQHQANEMTGHDSNDEIDIENSHALLIIKDILIEYWVNEGLMDSNEIDIDKTFTQLHIDSLGIVTLGIELERRIGQRMSIKTTVLYDTPRKLACYLDGLNNS